MLNRNISYIRLTMIRSSGQSDDGKTTEKMEWFTSRCREAGLRVTPQRTAVYRELLKAEDHPSAEVVYRRVVKVLPHISLDTVNRTLLTLAEIGAAFIVEGTGEAKRFDAGLHGHQHFRCVKCRRIVDFHYEPFDNVELPEGIFEDFEVLRKTVYVEGICDLCSKEG